MSNTAHNVTKDAKDAIRESGRAASHAAGDIQADLAALRDDVTRLASQLADIMATRGSAVWRKAVGEVQDKGMDAVGEVREVGDNMVDAIDESLKRRPYTTLALAVGMGFLFGATWRR